MQDFASDDSEGEQSWQCVAARPVTKHETLVMRVRVDGWTDSAGARAPRGFQFDDGRYVGITEMLDQWYGADYLYVKVMGDDGGLYILRFDEIGNRWDLKMFRSERGEEIIAKSGVIGPRP